MGAMYEMVCQACGKLNGTVISGNPNTRRRMVCGHCGAHEVRYVKPGAAKVEPKPPEPEPVEPEELVEDEDDIDLRL